MKRNVSEIASTLIKKLWEAYLLRVPYARSYVVLVNRRGGKVIFDHLGFRTLLTYTGEQPAGISAIRHIFDCLGYHVSQKYRFPKKRLNAVCLEAETTGLPKIFISQLDVGQLPGWARQLFPGMLNDTPYLLPDTGIELLAKLKEDGLLTTEAAAVLEDELMNYFRRPWTPPFKDAVLKLNDVSHYAAWVLLHGNCPSHFAVLVNQQEVTSWPDLKTTCDALKKYGLPMKEEIEGLKGSNLQQSATYAVKEDVDVRSEEGTERITWTYAYLELIQRGHVRGNEGVSLFPGFIESQERHLYNMTRTLDN